MDREKYGDFSDDNVRRAQDDAGASGARSSTSTGRQANPADMGSDEADSESDIAAAGDTE